MSRNTALYRIIQEHLESFLLHAHESTGQHLPRYVENEFRRYVECGLHAHGFARAVCHDWGEELLLPFSRKLRGICPSCNTRRMSNTAAHLVDHVIAPNLTLRQCELTVPFELRLLLAAKPDALSAIGRIFIQEIRAQSVAHARGQARARQRSIFVSTSTPASACPAGCLRHASALLRYCARPPLCQERLSLLEDGRICYRIKDIERARLMTLLQFLARLAALVPPSPMPAKRRLMGRAHRQRYVVAL